MKRTLQDLKYETYKKSVELKNINLDKIPYEKAQEIRKKQTKEYNKFQFLKNLSKAVDDMKNK